MAIGGDQGGSIRIPSSYNGTVGHKPTFGLVPFTGIGPIEASVDHTGPMARTVYDCALLLEVGSLFQDHSRFVQFARNFNATSMTVSPF